MQPIPRTFALGTLLKGVLIAGIIGLLLWYGYRQAHLLITGPTLALTETVPVVQHEPTTEITGIARNVTAITLNGRPIFTNESGVFTERLVLERGYTIMTIRAHDRYGREAVLTHPFVYAPVYE